MENGEKWGENRIQIFRCCKSYGNLVKYKNVWITDEFVNSAVRKKRGSEEIEIEWIRIREKRAGTRKMWL